MNNGKVLIIVTSHGTMGDTGEPTGFFWEELAAPYWALQDAGYQIDIASIQGGEPPADPSSDSADDRPDAVQRFMDSESAMSALHNSKKITNVDPADYVALYLPGGHGTMWDFAQSERLGEVVASAFENGAIVGSVCHGPAGLAGATLSNGEPLVRGRKVNSFTDEEEEVAGLTDVVPYLLESRLRDLGAQFEASSNPFQPHAVRDGRLVTGQNPASSDKVAALMITALSEEAEKKAA